MRAGFLIGMAVLGSFGAGWLARAKLVRNDDRTAAAAPEKECSPSRDGLAAMTAAAAGWKAACPTQLKLDPDEHQALVADLAAAVRSTVDAEGKPDVSHEEAPRAPVRKAPSPEALAAQKKAEELISHALAAHAWTDHDRMELMPLAGQLPAPEEVMRTLSQAMNDGRVAVRTQGPPF